MNQRAGEPQLSWTTIVGAVIIVGLLNSAQWIVAQTQFANVEKTETYDRQSFDKYLTKAEHKAYLDGIQLHLEGLSARVTTLEKQQTDTFSRLAHDPVEDRTFQAVIVATDKRIDLIQAQITDINRQIAAALIIIDNNAVARKQSVPVPP